MSKSENLPNYSYVIEFIDEKHGWAGGQSTGIWYTTDRGMTWKRGEPELPAGFILSISFVDSLNGWADGFGSGRGLPLLHTTDGGKNWKADSTMIAGRKVFFTDSLHGWTMRAGGGVWLTVDGGANWHDYPEPAAPGLGQFLDIFFVDSLVGYISNEIGTFSSVNGGRNWTLISEERASAMYFIDRHSGWGAGVTGRYIGSKNLAHTADGAKTWNSVVITSVKNLQSNYPYPSDFRLYDNYPNPFNAQTKIIFQVYQPHTPIRVNVYDILGQEVRTLVDKTFAAGMHYVVWDGKNAEGQSVAMGVYFYELSRGQQKAMKKMLLLP